MGADNVSGGSGAGREGRSAELARRLAESAQTAVVRRASAALDHLDDALFALAEQAETSTLQDVYFDAVREMRIRRKGIEGHFARELQSRLAVLLDETEEGRPCAANGSPSDAERSLSLVDDAELEDSLALETMPGHAREHSGRELQALTARLAVLAPNSVTEEASNPLGPRSIAAALAASIRGIRLDRAAKQVLYRMFGAHLLAELGGVYRQLNRVLAEAGVLPQLVAQPVAASRERLVPEGQATAPLLAGGAVPSSSNGVAGSGSAADQALLVEMLTRMLRAERGSGGSLSEASLSATAPGVGVRVLFSALETLRAQLEPNGGAVPTVVPDLRGAVLGQLQAGAATRSGTRRLSRTEEDALDVISILFDYVLDDRNIPVPIKALLARLQMPMVKVALLDSEFLRRRHHPAKELLNELAQAAVGWNEDGSPGDDALYGEIARLVGCVHKELDDDVALFARLLTEFRRYLERERKRAQLIERHTLQAEDARARSTMARQQVAAALESRISGHKLPDLVEALLREQWAQVMLVTLLRHGSDSEAWLACLGVMDRLVSSTVVSRAAAEGEGQVAETHSLLDDLRRGLASISYDALKAQAGLDQLGALLKTGAGPQTATAPPASPPGPAAEVALLGSPAQDSLPASAGRTAEGPPPAPVPSAGGSHAPGDQDLEALVEHLTPGRWLEFAGVAGRTFRAKLAQECSATGKLIFVSRTGVKLAEREPAELARELYDGAARILEDSALFERALTSAVQRLRGA